MPIRSENKHRYPKDWKAISLRIRERAGWHCENCGVPNGIHVVRDAAGGWRQATWLYDGLDWIDYPKVVLTVAHLDHMPENCADDNLRAWCQLCHNRYDSANRRQGVASRARARRALGDLFQTGGENARET